MNISVMYLGNEIRKRNWKKKLCCYKIDIYILGYYID